MSNTGISESQYALRSKELLSLLKKLRATGAQSELDLPRITVIGNQSAGKSSVVEAISGITVPRDAGTCTRCPMECRLSSSSSGIWSCKVSIRFEYDTSGKVLYRVSERPFGEVILEKVDVELTLRRAQTAVLNAHIPFEEILVMSKKQLKEVKDEKTLKFSRNIICVDLEGPELTDLSFIDLPGIIQNAEPSVVDLVEDMALSHIEGNCLILVALPMTDDIENQKALRLAREVDPDGHRTIGVMTKPDMLTAGSTARRLWLEVLEDQSESHPLVHGYFCTRHPDDDERASLSTVAEVRAREAEFFATTAPWSTSARKDRFGMPNLIAKLSGLLIRTINDTLPRIRSDATQSLSACARDLATIPEEIEGEPGMYMLKLLTSFSTDVQRFIDGNSNHEALMQANRIAFKEFKTTIRKTAPNFIPSSSPSRDVSSGRARADNASMSDPFYLDDMRRHIELSLSRELPDTVPFQAMEKLIKAFQKNWKEAVEVCFDSVRRSTIGLLEKRINERFNRHEQLQGHIKSFVHELVQMHRDEGHKALQRIVIAEQVPYTQNTHYLSSARDKWLATYKDRRAGKTTGGPPAKKRKTDNKSSIAQTEGNPGSQTASDSDSSPSVSPQTTPVKKVTGSSKPKQGSAKRPYEVEADEAEADEDEDDDDDDPDMDSLMALLAQRGYSGLIPKDLGKLNPPDEYETELVAMAQVRGYFQVAYKRIIDNVPQTIDLVFLRALGEDLMPFLISKLALGTVDSNVRCAMYLAEDLVLVARRRELKARKERLEEVQMALQSFGISSQ